MISSKKTKYTLCAVAAVFSFAVLLMSCIAIYFNLSMSSRAGMLLEQGAYHDAEQLYLKIGNRQMAGHCRMLINEQSYIQAQRSMQQGNYDRARDVFIALGEYKDSANKALSCEYLKAGELIEQGKYLQARDIALRLEGYPGQEALLDKCCVGIYDIAMELAISGKYADACEQWRELGAYKDCDTLLFRTERMLDWLEGDERIIDDARLFPNSYYENVYTTESAYVVVPENCSRSCRFFIYYPGGKNTEINTDFLYYYLMNPAPDTIAVFMRRNGIWDMEQKNSQALEVLERAAAECGVFVRKIMTAGSSLGAYPAMHSPRYSMQKLGIKVDCVLSLDAGEDWDTDLILYRSHCIETAEIGTQYYLFESPWVGRDRYGIDLMVKSGMDVTLVGCDNDEHVRITLDAMGMGIIHWALGDRAEPCGLDIYTFTKFE